jgi:hypothetical protein
MRLVPFYVPSSTTFTRIGVRISTSTGGSSVRLGIYSSNSDNFPTTLVLDAGTVDGSSTGSKSINISQTLSEGLYWLAATPQGVSGVGIRSFTTGYTFYVHSGTVAGGIDANPANCYTVSSISGSLPSTISSWSLGGNAPAVHLGV